MHKASGEHSLVLELRLSFLTLRMHSARRSANTGTGRSAAIMMFRMFLWNTWTFFCQCQLRFWPACGALFRYCSHLLLLKPKQYIDVWILRYPFVLWIKRMVILEPVPLYVIKLLELSVCKLNVLRFSFPNNEFRAGSIILCTRSID